MNGFSVNEIDMEFSKLPMDIGSMGKFNMGFTPESFNDDLLGNNPRAPQIISADFDEPADMFDIEDSFVNDVAGQMAFKQPKVPKLTETMGNIMGFGEPKEPKITVRVKKVPLVDDEDDDEEVIEIIEKRKRRKQRFDNKFEDIRFEQLRTGSNPLTGFEEQNFNRGRTFRGEE